MKCLICGGVLKYENGLYICLNCGVKQKISSFFEDTEVFICYEESDEQGRRTKDSIIAQDIYNKLQNANISSFFQRISAADLVGENMELAVQTAITCAKAIILCASSKENFSKLLYKYKNEFTNKKVIPVYTLLNASDIPKEISRFQAVNYDNVGSSTDLIKSLLVFLNKNSEIDVNSFKDKLIKKRKRLLISFFALFIAIAALISYIVFGTPYILKAKKYSYAEKLFDNANYTEAVDILTQLSDYKNSRNMLKSIYDLYEGYYYDESSDSTLHLVIENDSRANIEFERKYPDNTVMKFSEKGEIHGKQMSFNFTDNFGQDGVADIQIENTSLKLKIKSKESLELAFDLNSKSDAPLKEKISKDTLLSWLKTRTTISDIKALGYEIEYVTSWGSEEGTNRFYKISDTDIRFLTSAYDPTKEDLWSAPIQTDVYNNPFIMAIEAKAELMCPERIGQKDDSYIDDGIKYYPNGVPYNGSAQTEINHDTPVLVASDKLLSRNELLLPEKWYYTDDNSAETENDQSSFSLYD